MGTGRQGPRGSAHSSMHAYWDLSREDSDHIGFSLQPCAIELVRIPHRPDQPPEYRIAAEPFVESPRFRSSAAGCFQEPGPGHLATDCQHFKTMVGQEPPQRALIEVEEMFRDLDVGPARLLTPRLTRIYVGGLDPENPLRLQPVMDPSHHGEWITQMLDHVLEGHHIKRRGLELDLFQGPCPDFLNAKLFTRV